MKKRRTKIDRLVQHYLDHQGLVSQFQSQLMTSLQSSTDLMEHVHSLKARLKDPSHLKDKLQRKSANARSAGRKFSITEENLFTRVNDLAGIRVLHLNTRQVVAINAALKEIFEEQRFSLLEGPFARTWDDESRAYLESNGFETQKSPSLYTSIHYVVGSASRTKVTCEIQVRTLMEEVWGEVDHRINYPHASDSLACREQLKALARATSTATRLVDSIFASHADHAHHKTKRATAGQKRR